MPASVSDQARALETTAGVRLREDLVVVRVQGDDRRSWLNGQVTADVREISPGQGIYALAVNVRGKIMADLWVLDRGEHLLVLLPQSARESVLESFEHQIIMDDVELVPEPQTQVISVQGPRAGSVVEAAALAQIERHRCDELGHGGELVLCPSDVGTNALARLVASAEAVQGAQVSEAGFELARLRAGRPWFGRDFGIEHYPQEAGLLRAVSFHKGCYLGQEVVCTLENRGRLNKRLMRLSSDAAPPTAHAELHDGIGKVVGTVTSAVVDDDAKHTLALGYVKNAAAAPNTELEAGGHRITVVGAVSDS